MKKILLLLTILFAPFMYGQTTCPFDQTVFSGTVTISGIGASETKASDATNNHRFGERVSIDGDIAAVASRSNGAAAGKVYIFINDGSGNWTQQTILTASDGFAGDNFGSDIALEGNYLVVGARSQLNASDVDTGAAYLFEYNGVDTWTEVAVFEPSDGATDYRFGESVAIEGDIVIVGARKGCTGGCAYIYENDGTNTFTYTETKLEPQVQSGYDGARFGNEVKIKDGRAYVGGPYDYSSVGRASAGSVQIWDQANDGSWSRTHRLRGTETSESFGWSMDVEGEYLAIGAMNFETSTTAEADQGRVFVYKADSNGDYLEANRVMIQNDDKDSFTDQRFGTDVVLEDGYLYVGTWGDGTINGDAVYIFQDDGTNNWTQIAKITSGAGWDEFANRAVAVSFPTLIIGQNEADSPNNSGSVYFVSLANSIQPVASVTEIVGVNTMQSNGVIKVSFDDEATETQIKFSIDGGSTYPHVFDDTLGNAEITGLAQGSYDIWVAFDESSCPVNLGSFDVNEIPYTTISDANFEAALDALGYDDVNSDGQVPTANINTLTSLDVRDNTISDLTGIEDFVALEVLRVTNNDLTSLNISTLVNLKTLWAVNQADGFSTIDVSSNLLLEDLRLSDNSNFSIDISNNNDLDTFYCEDCGLNTLELGNKTSMRRMRLNNNNLTGYLDLSHMVGLEQLRINGNNLTGLNIQTGNNSNMNVSEVRLSDNDFSCITVDNVSYAETNFTSIDSDMSFSTTTYCEYTSIPDDNFESILNNRGYDDIVGDNQVPTVLISGITVLEIANNGITDFTGIEDFTALETFNAQINGITSFNVTLPPNLKSIDLTGNQLTAIDFTDNGALETLNLNGNAFTSIDISGLSTLKDLRLEGVDIDMIDISANANLEIFSGASSGIQSIVFGNNNSTLKELIINNNELTDIDLHTLTGLEQLYLNNNQLTELDVTKNIALELFVTDENQIETLDLSKNSSLTLITVTNNMLNALNLANGNNEIIIAFVYSGNSELNCIQVSNKTYADANFPSGAEFSEIPCGYSAIADANFESALNDLGLDDIAGDGYVPTENIENLTSLNVANKSISDLTGIEAFLALRTLICTDNMLTNLDTSSLTSLENLQCIGNSLTDLDLTTNTNLTFVAADNNQLATIDVSGLVDLDQLILYGNKLTTIDVRTNTDLRVLDLFGNDLTEIDLTLNTALTEVFLNDNELTEVDLRNGTNTSITTIELQDNSNLSCVKVDDAAYSDANWTNRDVHTNFIDTAYCRYTAIPDAAFEAYLMGQGFDDIANDGQVPTEIIEQVTGIQLTDNSISDLTGLEDFEALEVIDLNGTLVSSLDFGNHEFLEEVYLSNNAFTNIDLTNNKNLKTVNIVASPVVIIRLNNGENTSIVNINLNTNTQLSCVVVDDVTYATNNWTSINDLNLYSETLCGYTEIPDSKFEERLEALGYDDISGDGLIPTATIETVTELDIRGQQITDLTGIAAFAALKELRANDNLLLASPDFSANTALELLYIGENSFTDGLDLTANVNLKNLIIDELNIGSIDISTNTRLIQFEAEDCGFTSIDLSNNTALTTLDLGGNSLTSIDVTTLVQLESLSLEDNQISAIDLSNNTALETLSLDDNDLSTLDLSNNVVLESVQASRNSSMSSVNVTGLSSLKTLVFNSTDLSSIDVSTNTALDFFSVFGNQIETLDLSNNSVLSIVQVFDNVLTSIDLRNGNTEGIASINVSNNPDLDCISISNPIYATENFSTSVSFEALCGVYSYIPDDNFEAALGVLGLDDVANDNQIPTANIEPLTSLDISGEGIADLSGIAYFISLTTLDASFNNLDGTVDLSSNTLLETLNLEANGIQFLDFSSLPNLTSIKVDKNALLGLNIQNGSNTSLTSFNATENSSLNCILVDNAGYATTNFTNIDDHTSFNETDCTQYISIPDANFEAELIALGLDTVADGQVPYLNIYQTTALNLDGKNISDLTGIEGFDALIELNIHDNNLSTIDLSQNVLLQDLECDDNNFTALDLSSNVNLVTIDIDDNPQLTTVNVTGCVLLEEMIADDSNLSTLDLSTNVNLKILDLDNNNFTTIDLTNNVLLEDIDLESNDIAVLDLTTLVNLKDADLEDNVLTTIDLSKNILLESTDLDFNQFTSLDFTNNTALTRLDIDDNSLLTTVTFGAATNLQELYADDTAIATIDLSLLTGLIEVNLEDTNLRSLDVSKNINLVDLRVNNALLVSLDMRNGNNSNFTRFEATGNTNLECIIVDDVAYASTNWTDIDDATSFSDTYCRYTAIPDTNFEAELEAQGYDDISGDGQVPTALIEVVTDLDVSSKNVSDLTGIEDFIALVDLDCEVNTITSLDLSNNTLLETIDCDSNNLTLLDFGNNTNLKTLICNNNSLLTTLDLSNNTGLETIQGVNNGLTSINVNGLTALKSLSLNSNSLTTLDLTTNIALEIFTCGDNTISSIDVTNNTSLTYLSVTENALSSIDVTKNVDLVYLFCSDNSGMTALDVTNNTSLEWLYVQNNNLTTIDLSNNVLLEKLWLNDNQLTSLDVTNNIALTEFVCYSNSLSALDVSNNTQLDWFYCDDNNLTSLDLTTNTALTSFNCSNNALTSLNLQNGNNTSLTFSVFTNNPDLNCILVDDEEYSTTNWTNVDVQTSFNETSCNTVVIVPKVFLQGALLNPNTGEENWMRDDLRVDNGLYGATSPYGDGIQMSEAIGLDDAGSNSTIDWIWVELRDATDPTQVIAGQSAILQRDGDVVDVAEDRVTPLTFDVPVGDYYVVIKHRNHLGVMTAASISLSQTATSVDFTDGSVATYGTNGQTTYGMPTGVSAMWAGDANGDGKINLIGTSNDSNEIRDTILNDPINLAIQFYGFNVTGYNDADANLTGGTQIIGSDNDANLVRDNILNHPINTFIQFYGFSITEQLPENVTNTRIAMDIALLEKMKVLASKNK